MFVGINSNPGSFFNTQAVGTTSLPSTGAVTTSSPASGNAYSDLAGAQSLLSSYNAPSSGCSGGGLAGQAVGYGQHVGQQARQLLNQGGGGVSGAPVPPSPPATTGGQSATPILSTAPSSGSNGGGLAGQAVGYGHYVGQNIDNMENRAQTELQNGKITQQQYSQIEGIDQSVSGQLLQDDQNDGGKKLSKADFTDAHAALAQARQDLNQAGGGGVNPGTVMQVSPNLQTA